MILFASRRGSTSEKLVPRYPPSQHQTAPARPTLGQAPFDGGKGLFLKEDFRVTTVENEHACD